MDLEFDIHRIADSYTAVFVGLNEAGKSNLLTALKLFGHNNETFSFPEINNKKNIHNSPIELYFEFDFDPSFDLKQEFSKKTIFTEDALKKIVITKFVKKVFLESTKNKLEYICDFWIDESLIDQLLYRPINDSSGKKFEFKSQVVSNALPVVDLPNKEFNVVTPQKLKEILREVFNDYINSNLPKVNFWKSEEKYLITGSINLNQFKEDSYSNIPLRNIFLLSGYASNDEIKNKINEFSLNPDLRRSLADQLSKASTKYLRKKWSENKIRISVEIDTNNICLVHVQDDGETNSSDYFNMKVRSDGFKQFVSLLLSLSIECDFNNMKNNLILIDEPENHLHPSGIRCLKDELLMLGKENYVFLSTHSPFLVDSLNKNRNYIVLKNKDNNTELIKIESNKDFTDDEVLNQAFGINVYRDFLAQNKLLVEGKSDKKILGKVISKLKLDLPIAISNGYGSNIVSIASKLMYDNIPVLVLVDDDLSGQKYKEQIIKLGSNYSSSNVLTIRDVESNLITNGTIEDMLGVEFIQSELDSYWASFFDGQANTLKLKTGEPVMQQIKVQLSKLKSDLDSDKFNDGFKTKVSDDFNPSNLEKNFPLLKNLVENIEQKFKEAHQNGKN
jgi:predicted ATP-dependent endonuclease of OLD family